MARRPLLVVLAACAMFAASLVVVVAAILFPSIRSVTLPGGIQPFAPAVDQRERARLDRLLQEGLGYQRDGDYEKAIAAFGEVAKAKPGIADIREAQFQLGRTYLLIQDPRSAASIYQEFYDRYTDDERRDRVAFMLGMVYREQRDWDKAAGLLTEYLQRNTAVEGYARYQLGLVYRDAGNLKQAIEEFAKAVTGSGPRLFEIEVMEKIAEAYLKLGDLDNAAAWYEKIMLRAATDPYKAELNYRIALIYKTATRIPETKDFLLYNVANYPSAHYTLLSMEELNRLEPGAVGNYQRGLIYYLNGEYDKAISSFGQLLVNQPQDRNAGDALYYQGMAFQEQGSYPQSISKFDQLLSSYPNSTRVGDAWFQKAESQAWQKNYDDAIATYRRFAGALPNHELAQQARWEAARLLEALRRLEEAAGEYATLQRGYPTGKHAEDALFRLGLAHYKQGSYDRATQVWDGYLKAYPDGAQRARGAFWAGKASMAAGKSAEANRYFQQAMQATPDEFYGFRAKSLTSSTGGSPPLDQLRLELSSPDTEAERQEAADWMGRWVSPPPTVSVLSEMTVTLKEDPAFRRGEELLKVGLKSKAVEEYKTVVDRFRSDPVAQLQLSLYFRDSELYQLSIGAAQRLAILSGEKNYLSLPRLILRLLYPPYYGNLILAESEKGGFDPLLFLSLIRQESNFDRTAFSSAEARGLTQVIPSTGEWLAQKLGLASFSPDDLFKPYLSVRFGATYLGGLLDQFDGNAFFALAGYNGGPGNVSRWSNGDLAYDVDLFAEDISYGETSRYVKLVLGNHEMYKFIYGSAR